jgi:site-specific DNA-methyltransferase (adenine-specific)
MASQPPRKRNLQPNLPIVSLGTNEYLVQQKIFQGDWLGYSKTIPDGSVDLEFYDPPFNIGYEYDEYHDRQTQDDYEAMISSWAQELYRILKPTGTVWLAIGDEQVSELDIIMRKAGFHKRSWVVWHYTFGVNCANKLTRSHAHLIYYTKHREKFTFNPQLVPSARQLEYNDKRAKAGGRNPDDTWILRPQWCPQGFYQDQDTWYVPRINGTFKERAGTPNQMPEHLLARIIRMCSNEHDIVFDPCCGSGTTPVTAKKLNRRGLGCELSVEYAAAAQQRMENTKVGDKLAGPEPLGTGK